MSGFRITGSSGAKINSGANAMHRQEHRTGNYEATTKDGNPRNETSQTNMYKPTAKIRIPANTANIERELIKELPEAEQGLISSLPFHHARFYNISAYADPHRSPFKAIVGKRDGEYLMLKIRKVIDNGKEKRAYAILTNIHPALAHLPTIVYIIEDFHRVYSRINGDQFAKIVSWKRPEFLSATGYELSALIKYYFFREGVTIPYEIVLIKTNFHNDLLRAARGIPTEIHAEEARTASGLSRPRAPLATASVPHQQSANATGMGIVAREWSMIQKERNDTGITRKSIWKALEKVREEEANAKEEVEKARKQVEIAEKALTDCSSKENKLMGEHKALLHKDAQDAKLQKALVASLPEDEQNAFRLLVKSARKSRDQHDDEPLAKRLRTYIN